MFAALVACGDKQEHATTSAQYYESSRQCIRDCDETEQNASSSSVGCRDTFNGSYRAAVVTCADGTPYRRAERKSKAGEADLR